MLKEIKKQSLLDSIVRAIEEYIIVNDLKAGDRLPTEKFLKENLKVGRNSVREALKALEVIGLVSSKPGKGTVVSSENFDPFLLSVVFGFVLEDIEIKHLNEFRLVIELGACRIAIKNAKDSELNKLMKIARKLDKQQINVIKNEDKEAIIGLATLEKEFHKYLIELSHNPILLKFQKFWDIYFSRVQASGELYKASEINVGKEITHTAIVEAIKERNEQKAIRAMKYHLVYYWLQKKEDISKDFLVKLISNSEE